MSDPVKKPGQQPESYQPKKPEMMKLLEEQAAPHSAEALLPDNGIAGEKVVKKQLDFNIRYNSLELLSFIQRFTAAYMFLENIDGSGDVSCKGGKNMCCGCAGIACEYPTAINRQAAYFFLFNTMTGNSALRCRIDVQPTAMQTLIGDTDEEGHGCGSDFTVDFLFGYAGYEYRKCTDDVAFKDEITASIDAGKPVIVRAKTGSPRFCLITGYDGDALLCADYRNVVYKPGKGNVLADKPEEPPAYSELDALYIFGEKTAPRYTMKDGLANIRRAMECNFNEHVWDDYLAKLSRFHKASPAERKDTPHFMASVTKSVTSALVGIAIGEGYIEGVDQKVIDFFPDAAIAPGQESKRDMTIFNACGYDAEFIFETALRANPEPHLQKLIAYIDRGIPVIRYWCGWHTCVGYEDGGKTLLCMTGNKEEPYRVTSQELFEGGLAHKDAFDSFGWIFVGEKKEQKDLRQLYRDAIYNLPRLLTTKTEGYCFGAEAYRVWADEIESGKFEGMKPEEFDSWANYICYVCALATNSGGSQDFMRRAMRLYPDLTFLKDVCYQYRVTGMLWDVREDGWYLYDCPKNHGEPCRSEQGCRNCKQPTPEQAKFKKQYKRVKGLEQLGGGFNIKLKTLQSPRKRAKIAAVIRKGADCMDEVVRVLEEGLQ